MSDDETRWISDLLENGFTFHHAKGSTAVLTRWLPEGESSGIPEYPSLYIGVGTITINDKNEILCIKEKVRWYNNWKFPGGYVDKKEFKVNNYHKNNKKAKIAKILTTVFLYLIELRAITLERARTF